MMNFKQKAQRKLNKQIRELNKSIYNDELWQGRFEVRQKFVSYEIFDDGSGGLLHVGLRFVDKEIPSFRDRYFIYNPHIDFFWQVWREMNDFIISCQPPYNKDRCKDYRGVPIPQDVIDVSLRWY